MHDNEILVGNWIVKSRETLQSAEKNIEINELATAQNRLYYAVFYAVSALAQKNNFATSKHSQLKGWFSREFIKTNRLDKKYGKLYFKLFESRQKSDYTFTYKPNEENLLINLGLAKEFIEEIEKEVL